MRVDDNKKYKVKCYRTFEGREFGPANGGYESGISGYYVYEYRGKEYLDYNVYSLDVWGNSRDGFEVNDRSRVACLKMPVDWSKDEIIKCLKSNNLLNKKCHFKSFSIQGDDLNFSLESKKNGEPLYQIEVT